MLQFPIGSANENNCDTQYLHLCLLAGQFKIIPPDNPVIGVIGKGVILPCQLEAKTTPERLFVQWIFTGKSQRIDVTTYDGKNKQNPISEDKAYQGRTNFFQTEFNKGNVSLHLKNVMLSDEGKYTCSIFLENWYDEVVVDLNVAGEWSVRCLLLLPQSSFITSVRTVGYEQVGFISSTLSLAFLQEEFEW